MNRRNFLLSSAGALSILLFSGRKAWAGKAETRIEAPVSVQKGSEAVIRITVVHNTNSMFHHVEWLWVKINDQEIARWDYGWTETPEGATFTKEIRYVVNGDMQIAAKASCNLHGSANEPVVKISAT
jgi:desulfoferrodoxin (superoxide reductase-like protein)